MSETPTVSITPTPESPDNIIGRVAAAAKAGGLLAGTTLTLAVAHGAVAPSSANAASLREGSFPPGEVVANTTKAAIAGLTGHINNNQAVHTAPGNRMTWQTPDDTAEGMMEYNDNPLMAMVRSPGGEILPRFFAVHRSASDGRPVVTAIPKNAQKLSNPAYSPNAFQADDAVQFVRLKFSPTRQYATATLKYVTDGKVISTVRNAPIGRSMFGSA